MWRDTAKAVLKKQRQMFRRKFWRLPRRKKPFWRSTWRALYFQVEAEKEAVLKALKAGGDYEAEELLRCLQGVLIQAAKELNCREIFFGDLLQEGNMGLLMAVKSAEEQENLAKWLLEEARSTMRLFIEDQTQQKKRTIFWWKRCGVWKQG